MCLFQCDAVSIWLSTDLYSILSFASGAISIFLLLLNHLRRCLWNCFWIRFLTLSILQFTSLMTWNLSAIILALGNKRLMAERKAVLKSITTFSTCPRSYNGYLRKWRNKLSMFLDGRISNTLCVIGSATLHWNFSLLALPLNSSILKQTESLGSGWLILSNQRIILVTETLNLLDTALKGCISRYSLYASK